MNIQFDVNRYYNIFVDILNRRIVPFVEEYVMEILDPENFSGYYKEEHNGNDTFIRPIYELTKYGLIIVSLIVNELNDLNFIKKFNLDTNPINTKLFFIWLHQFLIEKHIFFNVKYINKETGEVSVLRFFTLTVLDYRKISQEGYEYLL